MTIGDKKITSGKKMRRLNTLSFAILAAALIDGDKTLTELAEECGLSYRTVMLTCRSMKEKGAVHVAGWDPDPWGRMNRPLYKLGAGRNKSKPPKEPKYLASRRYRERQRAANPFRIKPSEVPHAGL